MATDLGIVILEGVSVLLDGQATYASVMLPVRMTALLMVPVTATERVPVTLNGRDLPTAHVRLYMV